MNLIGTDEIAALRARGDTIFVDARGGPDAYERFASGHLEDAFFVDLETELSDKSLDVSLGGRHPLPLPGEFGRLLGSFGIMPSTTVVVYDDKRGANAAARFWWMLKAVGHENAVLVDGGLDAIIAAGLPVTTDEITLLSESPVYPVLEWELPIASSEDVASAAGASDWLVIDVREGYRYRGEGEPIDLVAGHIPGAVNVAYVENLDEQGNFLSATQLKEKYLEILGDVPPEKVIIHCGSGVTACHTLLALEEAGFSGASLYVGSWSEWSRSDRDIATGEQ
jgi:thiosulfate/3-mercaptopyruvate sulfurtransferase